MPPCQPRTPYRHGGQEHADGRHQLKRKVHEHDRRPVLPGNVIEAGHRSVGIAVREHAETAGDLDGVRRPTRVDVWHAAEAQRSACPGLELAFHGGQLRGLRARHHAPGEVARHRLQQGRDQSDPQRDGQRGAMQRVFATD